MAYPFQKMDTQRLIRFWEVLLYKKETNRNDTSDTFDTLKQTDKFSRNKHNPPSKSTIFRPQRQRET